MRISDWSSDVCSSDLRQYLPVDVGTVLHQLDEDDQFLAIDPEASNEVGKNVRAEGVVRPQRETATVDGFVNQIPAGSGARREQSQQNRTVGGSSRRSAGRRVGKECVRPGRSRW